MKKYRIYFEQEAETEEEAFKIVDELVEQAITEESTIGNTFAIKKIK